MKKFITILLILLCFSSGLALAQPTPTNIYKQGIYTPQDLKNFAINTNTYNIQNVSTTKDVYIAVLNKDFLVVQGLYLPANSNRFNLVPLKSDYRVAIIGDGDVYIL